jgi:8-oxo-dGTP diphosphatase
VAHRISAASASRDGEIVLIRLVPSLAQFTRFHEVSEADRALVVEPAFAVVIARSPGGVVLVFNRYRKVWELPGGYIDAGESPREAAQRELFEEAACRARDLHWLGLVEVNDGAAHFGAVYQAHVDSVPADIRNDEIDGIGYWKDGESPQPLGATDRALLHRFGGSLAQ